MSDIHNKDVILGEKIKARRKELKMTMTELAAETNLSQSAISMIENGLRQPTFQTVQRISQVLRYDFSKILLADQLEQAPSITPAHAENITFNVLQFQVTMNITDLKPALPTEDLNQLVIQTLQQDIQTIMQQPATQQKLEAHITQVIKDEIERKKRELDKTLNILDL